MADFSSTEAKRGQSRQRLVVWLTALALVAAAAVGVALVLRFVAAERARDLHAWQLRLGVVAESRKAAIGGWLARQWDGLDAIAGNESVRLYLTQLGLAGGDPNAVPDGAGQIEYLENLLAVAADQGGFKAPVLGADVPANVSRTGLAGVVILGPDRRVLAASPGAPMIDPGVLALVGATAKGQRGFRDLFLDAAGRPALAFLVPVYAIQADAVAAQQVGAVLGVKEVASELYPLLRQPGATESTAAAVLVRRAGAVVEFLSPLADGTAPLALKLAMNTPELAAAAALEAPGGFGLMRDAQDRRVLFTSRAIEGTPWVLLYEVDSAEALADTDRRQRRLLTVFLLAILLAGAAIVALWQYGASKRAGDAARRYRKLAERFEQQQNFLRLVTDSQPNAIFIADEGGHYRFANRKAGEAAGMTPADMIGKTLASVLGAEAAKRHTRLNDAALEGNAATSAVHRTGEGRALRVLQSRHIPLAPSAEILRGVLIVEEDITAAISERERRERTLDQLVTGLVALVDQRDPYAAHHSTRVAAIARAIAVEMGLEPRLVETARIAGSLMNLGKILVPADILTKGSGLSAAEIGHVRDSLEAGADFLAGIEFDGPVVDTLRQCRANWDGSGRPGGLAGNAVLPTARVVAVANAFVAMTSARAHRPGLAIDTAIEALLAGAGTRFDRAVVAALVNYLDNKGGRAEWAAAPSPPQQG